MMRDRPDQTLGRPAGIPGTLALLSRWVDAGECMSGQIFVSRDGHVVANVAVGSSGPRRNSSAEDLGRLYCAVKPITACCLARGVEAGEASFDDLVSRFLPDFSSGPRRTITLRQLLSHTSGLPNLPIVDPYDYEFPDLVRKLDAALAPCLLVPQAYNNTHAWNILAAVAECLYGEDLASVVTRVVATPLERPVCA